MVSLILKPQWFEAQSTIYIGRGSCLRDRKSERLAGLWEVDGVLSSIKGLFVYKAVFAKHRSLPYLHYAKTIFGWSDIWLRWFIRFYVYSSFQPNINLSERATSKTSCCQYVQCSRSSYSIRYCDLGFSELAISLIGSLIKKFVII
jgi:hypothetical protein